MTVDEDATQATPELKTVGSEAPETQEPNFQVRTADMEAQRRAQWKAAIQQELQELVQQAADIRKKINDAKTQYKKDFYNKKFMKTQTKVMQMVGAMQRLEMHDKQATAGSIEPHVHDENCQHDHEEAKNEAQPPEAS